MQTSRRTETRSRNQGGDPMVRDVSAEHLGTALRRRWWAPLVGLILGLGIALGLAASEPPQYESVTTMMVHAGADDDTAAERLARTADVLLAVGDDAARIAAGFDAAGGAGVSTTTAGRAEAADWLRHNVSAADVVLVKASRGAALELIADDLLTGSGKEGRRTR